MAAKLNNRRVYPDANHQPNHKAKFRMDEAKERQEAYDKLSIEEKVAKLDAKLGAGAGAVKQRARLAKALEDRKNRKEAIASAIDKAKKDGAYEATEHQTSELDVWKDSKKDNKQKKYMKGAK